MDRITLMASGSRTCRGHISQVSWTEASVVATFPARIGEIVFLAGVFDTIVGKIACRVVAAGPEGLELRFVAMTRETQEALGRHVLQRRKVAAAAAREPQRRFKVLPGKRRPPGSGRHSRV